MILLILTVFFAGMVSFHIQLPPLPSVAVVAVNIRQIVTSTLELDVFVTVALPINFFSELVVLINTVAVVPICVSLVKFSNEVAIKLTL